MDIIGMIAKKLASLGWNHVTTTVADKEYQQIMSDYELYYCKSQEDFWVKFERLPNEKKTVIFKMHPNLHDLVETSYPKQNV